MSTLKSLALSSSLVLPGALFAQVAALAQAPAAPAAAPAAPAAPTAQVVPYGVIQGRMYLMDSSRQNTPDASLLITRIGLKVNHGVAYGQIETGLTANTYEVADERIKTDDAGAPVLKDGKAVKETHYRETNRILVRMADAGVNLKPSDMVGLSLGVGRVRPGAADAWGASNSWGPDGYAYVDGLKLKANLNIMEGSTVGLGFHYGNTLIVPAGVGSRTARVENGSIKSDHAMVANLSANIAGVKAAFFYGSEANQPQGAGNPYPIRQAGGDDLAHDEANRYADVSHIEASLGYQLDAIGAGVSMQQVNVGKAKKTTKAPEGGKLSLTDSGDPLEKSTKKTTTTWSLGVNGDSTLWGMADLAQTGDKLVWGASYGMTQTRAEKATVSDEAKKKEKDADETNIVLGGGYSAGSLTMELNLIMLSKKGKNYTNSKGEGGDKGSKTKTIVAIDSTYAF